MKRNSALTKEKIDNAAISLFVENGVDATTTKMIAKTAEVAEGSLYRHYTSKDDLVLNLFLNNYVELANELIENSAKVDSSIDKVKLIVEEVINKFQTRKSKNLIYFLLISQHSQIVNIPKETLTPVKVVHSIIEEGIEKGEIKDLNPEILTSMVFGLVTQPIQFSYYGKRLKLKEEIKNITKSIELILEEK